MNTLKFLLELHSTSGAQLAKKLNVTRQHVNQWVKGEQKIPEKYFNILSRIFHVPEIYFAKEELNENEVIESRKALVLHGNFNNQYILGIQIVQVLTINLVTKNSS